jgi:hypothetical protein
MSNTQAGYVVIYSPADAGITHTVHVPAPQKQQWEQIKKDSVGNYYMTSLVRAVLRLAVGDKTVNSQAVIGDFKFTYKVSADRKNIFINLIELTESGPKTNQSPGLYKAIWNGAKWATESDINTSMDLNHKWSGGHVAVVPGQFESKEYAGERIGTHVEKAYFPGNTSSQNVKQDGNHFSLFWLNNEFTSKQHKNSLVSLIQTAQKQSANVKWLVHGEGAATFIEAMKFIKNNPKSTDLFAAQKGMSAQEVYFSNPRGKHSSKKTLEEICKSIGMNCAGVNINTKDVLYNADARKGMLTEVTKVMGGAMFAGGGAAGLGNELGVDTFMKVKELATTSPGLASMLVIAGGVIVVASKGASASGYVRNMHGAISSTFGSGNQNWAG